MTIPSITVHTSITLGQPLNIAYVAVAKITTGKSTSVQGCRGACSSSAGGFTASHAL
jgi:hypothetical protein